jgi:hypothetical protein
MTYAVTIEVHAPTDGFQVLEVWDTKASYAHFNDTVIAPLTRQGRLHPRRRDRYRRASGPAADLADVRHGDRHPPGPIAL